MKGYEHKKEEQLWYVYEIPGVKVGISTDWKSRIRKQKHDWTKCRVVAECWGTRSDAIAWEEQYQKVLGYEVEHVKRYSNQKPAMKSYWDSLSAEERKARNKNSGKKGFQHSNSAKTLETNRIKAYEKVECPHCGKVGARNNMTRWHFDNCKSKIY